METALREKKRGKVAEPTGVRSDLLKAGRKGGVRWLTNIMNNWTAG